MHFLRKTEVHGIRSLERRWACVTVKLVKKDVLEIQPGSIGVGKIDSQWVRLPERIRVVDPDGEEVKPSKGRFFWVSIESFDPFHLVTEGDEFSPIRGE